MINSEFFVNTVPIGLDQILFNIGDGVVFSDKNYNLLGVNTVYANMYGMTPQELAGKNAFDVYPEFNKSLFFKTISETLRTGVSSTSLGYAEKIKSWLACRCYKYSEKDEYYILIVHRLTEDIQKTGYTLNHDNLTSLPNRFMFENDVVKVSEVQKKLGFLLCDVKKFSNLNKQLGTSTGDLCLMEIAVRLKQAMGANDSLYRLTADQFLIMTTCSEHHEMLSLAQSAQEKMEKPFSFGGKSYQLDLHISAYVSDPKEAQPHTNVIKYLELALNHGKKIKVPLTFYSEDISDVSESLEMGQMIKKALENNEFQMHYQPQADMITKRVCGAEALIRWIQPEKGFIPPDKFLGVASELELMPRIDKWVFDRVLSDAQAFKEQGIDTPISINISSDGFSDKALQEHILTELDAKQPNIVFEITETGFMDVALSKEFIDKLKEKNYKIAIDDFGTGYCSLEYLLHYTTDYLKIDRKFITNIHEIKKNQSLVSNILKLGQSLGSTMVAEGVETQAEWDMLKAYNCDIVQGYLFSKPLNTELFKTFCKEHGLSDLKSQLR